MQQSRERCRGHELWKNGGKMKTKPISNGVPSGADTVKPKVT